MASPARKTIGSYEIERELGQGGMGVVYLARQPALEREVVIKTLRRSLAEDATIEERFQREAQAAARVHHQNVVAVYDCFAWRGESFIAQEYVAGEDLASILQMVRRLSPRIGGLVALELARGLEEVHAQAVVHRDLKPSNILLGRSGEVKIADFGIALEARNTALTQIGFAVGTPAYMSPEQHLGERADQRSDLFSFGVVFYELLTGEAPFPECEDDQGEALLRRMEAGRYVAPRKRAPEIPRALALVIRRCLRPKAKKRLQSASELRGALERCLGRPSPIECRREIASWLWERKVFHSEENETELVQRPPERTKRPGPFRWVAAVAACGALFAAVDAIHLGKLPFAVAIPGTGHEAARVRFEAAPQTEIRIDGGPPFRAARDVPIELAPGVHQVVFEHPKFGRGERKVEIAAGEETLISQVFDSTPGAK